MKKHLIVEKLDDITNFALTKHIRMLKYTHYYIRGEFYEKFIQDFKVFIKKGNVLDMAVGVVIGAVLNFLIVAFCIFCLVRIVNSAGKVGRNLCKSKKQEEAPAPALATAPDAPRLSSCRKSAICSPKKRNKHQTPHLQAAGAEYFLIDTVSSLRSFSLLLR